MAEAGGLHETKSSDQANKVSSMTWSPVRVMMMCPLDLSSVHQTSRAKRCCLVGCAMRYRNARAASISRSFVKANERLENSLRAGPGVESARKVAREAAWRGGGFGGAARKIVSSVVAAAFASASRSVSRGEGSLRTRARSARERAARAERADFSCGDCGGRMGSGESSPRKGDDPGPALTREVAMEPGRSAGSTSYGLLTERLNDSTSYSLLAE